jgi:predicted CXXCH cytochrome family protein
LLLEGKKCARCHDPHAGKAEYLLLDNSQSLCLNCHAKDVKSADGRVIANLKEVLDKGVHPHGPGKSLDCTACHQPHANKQFRFLRGPYPQKFYSPYSDEIYGLCFTCHDKSLAAEAQTDEATEFRNGSRNLHYLHVNKKKKGRTCRACHAWHVSKNAQLLRESVPFGQWRIPINFTATENGGTCGPGCHRGKAYDRVMSVSYNPAPASHPVQKGPAPAAQRGFAK